MTARVLIAVALLSTLLSVAASQKTPKKKASPIDGLSWLAGDWEGKQWGGEFRAYYSTPEGGKVLSFSELLRSGKVVYHEFERFETRKDSVVMTPYPKGRPAGSFTLTSVDPKKRRAVFENPKKDFPTRIVYERESDKRLVITLTDAHGKSEKTEVFDLQQAASTR